MNGFAFEAPTVGIGRLLKEGTRLFVPSHQRDYCWSEDEIGQLFSDIDEARSSDQDEYFIGLMVFMRRGQRDLTILDGQQRLATTLIILSAVRGWLKARDYDDDASQIQSDYIAVRELGSDEQEARLVLNELNNPRFETYVIREAATSDIGEELQRLRRYDPNRRLIEAILYCRSHVEKIARDSGGSAQALFDLVRYLQDGVKVVRLTVANEANAYTVFETLNDRGLDLTVLDLVKNYLFGKATTDARLREIQSRWTQMMANLSNVRADDFLKAWWTSRYGRVQTAQLFPKFKDQVRQWSHVSQTAQGMLAASEQYAALEVADDPLWAEVPHEGRESIRALKLLGGRQVHPVLLSALDKFTERALNRLLKLLEVLIVRYQLIGGGRTGRLEIICASLAHHIYLRQVRTATDALKSLKDIFPTNQEFKDSFKSKQEKNNQKVFYLLSRLENQARREELSDMAAIELIPSVKLTVEHIFPKRPGRAWADLQNGDETFAEDCTYRLGNICLLTGVNRSLGNDSFDVKKKTYAKSNLVLTKELSEKDAWTRVTVEQRQARMARLAASVWSFQ